MTECKLKGTRIVEIMPLREMELKYFLLEEMDEAEQTISYGVEIRKTESEQVEVETVKGVTDSKEMADHLIELLVTNTVTPISLVNVVDDYITEKVCS